MLPAHSRIHSLQTPSASSTPGRCSPQRPLGFTLVHSHPLSPQNPPASHTPHHCPASNPHFLFLAISALNIADPSASPPNTSVPHHPNTFLNISEAPCPLWFTAYLPGQPSSTLHGAFAYLCQLHVSEIGGSQVSGEDHKGGLAPCRCG